MVFIGVVIIRQRDGKIYPNTRHQKIYHNGIFNSSLYDDIKKQCFLMSLRHNLNVKKSNFQLLILPINPKIINKQ